MVYASESLAICILEMLVHLDSDLVPTGYAAYTIEIPDTVASDAVDPSLLPKNWHRAALCSECLRIGESWLDYADKAVLRVPSAVVPNGWNVLINPNHASAGAIRVRLEERFAFDPRIL